MRKLLGVDRFVGLAYVIEGALYGTSVVALKTGTPDPPREEVETFASLAAVSLRRRRAEAELARQTEQVDTLFALSGDILGIGGHGRRHPSRQPCMGGHPRLSRRPRWRAGLLIGFVHPDDRAETLAGLADAARSTRSSRTSPIASDIATGPID